MKKHSLTLLAAVCLVTASFIGTVVFSQNSKVMPGGYAKVAVTDKNVMDSLQFIKQNFPVIQVVSVNEAYRHVVAGLNINLVCAVTCMGKKATWELVVYKNLDNAYFLTSAKEVK